MFIVNVGQVVCGVEYCRGHFRAFFIRASLNGQSNSWNDRDRMLRISSNLDSKATFSDANLVIADS